MDRVMFGGKDPGDVRELLHRLVRDLQHNEMIGFDRDFDHWLMRLVEDYARQLTDSEGATG